MLGYDGRGNLSTDTVGGATTTYLYDVNNRLTSLSNGATLSYDPAGNLFQTTGGSTTTRFLYDGDRIIGEYDGSGAVLRRYVPGAGPDETAVWYEGSGTSDRRWLVHDWAGSVIAATDASGNPSLINTYDEAGIPGQNNAGRFQWRGQPWIPEAGLYHMRARAYSPTLGRFLQPDPIGTAGGMNLYAYAGNDPVNGWDPSGLLDEIGPNGGSAYLNTKVREVVVTAPRPNPPTIEYPPPIQIVVPPSVSVPNFVLSLAQAAMAATPQGPQRNQNPNPCNTTPNALANSGRVTFKYTEFSATAVGTSGDAFGRFTTAGGYTGTFHTYFDGAFVGTKGLAAAYGGGTSQSLATFQGVNYNVIGTIGPWSFSDNYDPKTGKKVGDTDALTTPGLGGGTSRSNTTLLSLRCSGNL